MKVNDKAHTTAYLSSEGSYTMFAFKDKRITFLTINFITIKRRD